MHFKSKLVIIALLLTGWLTMSAQTLVLHHADGTTTDVELFTQPRVQFEGDHVLITSAVLSIDYAKQDVVRFTYRGGSLGIESTKPEADVTREQDRLVFHGVRQADRVAVYRPNGIRVPVRLTLNGTDAVLPLSQIPQGVYLIQVNGRTSKFTRP